MTLNGASGRSTPVTVSAVVPVLAIVTVNVLGRPVGTVPKVRAEGVAASPVRVPEPRRSTAAGPALVCTERTAATAPVRVGVRATGTSST